MQTQKSLATSQKTLATRATLDTVDVTSFIKDFTAQKASFPTLSLQSFIEVLRSFEKDFLIFDQEYDSKKIHSRTQPNQANNFEEIKIDLDNHYDFYDLHVKINDHLREWEKIRFEKVHGTNLYVIEDAVRILRDDCLRLPKDLKKYKAYSEMKNILNNWQDLVYVTIDLAKPSVKPRHWEEIQQVIGTNFNYGRGITLKDLLLSGIHTQTDVIEEVTTKAERESYVERSLKSMQETWEITDFYFYSTIFREGDCIISKNDAENICKDLKQDLDELEKLSLKTKFEGSLKEIRDLTAKFKENLKTLEMWLKVQDTWVNLDVIFKLEDFKQKYLEEAEVFKGLDQSWIKMMEECKNIKNAMKCCEDLRVKDTLRKLKEGFEQGVKLSKEYYENLRRSFPRLYFTSEWFICSILSDKYEKGIMQRAINHLYEGVDSVQLDHEDGITGVTHACSKADGAEESLGFGKKIVCEGKVEIFYENIGKEISKTVKKYARNASQFCQIMPLKEFVGNHPLQLLLLGTQIQWTGLIEAALKNRKNGDKKQWDQVKLSLAGAIKTASDLLTNPHYPEEKPQRDLNKKKLEVLMTLQNHIKDVVAAIDQEKFDWEIFLRVYWKNDAAIVSIGNWDIEYYYEYLGLKQRVFVTPITEKYYVTITEALKIGQGCAIIGPEAQEKEGIIKDLAGNLGMPVKVIDCKKWEYEGMVSCLKGICQMGIWGVFEGFEKLVDKEIVEKITGQLDAIVSAQIHELSRFQWPGEEGGKMVDLKKSTRCFLTLNTGERPEDYELPESLKTYFRSVAIVSPYADLVVLKHRKSSIG